jgi:hypothetical protein
MMGLFDTSFEDDFSEKTKSKNSHSIKKEMKIRNIHDKRKSIAKEIIEEIGAIEENENIDVVTNGESNAGSFAEYYLDKYGIIDEICIATWIINRYYIKWLIENYDKGLIKAIVFVVSNRMNQLPNTKANFNYLKTEFIKRKNIKLIIANSHAKTFSFKANDNYITIDGSANWSENPRIETYSITRSKEKHNFRKQWMTQLQAEKRAMPMSKNALIE